MLEVGGVEKLWVGLERLACLGGWGRAMGLVRLSGCESGWV